MKRWFATLILLVIVTSVIGQPEVDIVSASGDSLRLDRVVKLVSDGVVKRDLFGDNKAAKELFEAALELEPDNIATNYQYSILMREFDIEESLIRAQKAYLADTTNKWSQEHYAQTLLMNRDYAVATSLFRQMIRREPNNPDYYRILALLYQFTSRPHSAISVLDSAEMKVGKRAYLSQIKQELLLSTMQEQRALDEALDMVANTPYDIQSRLSLANVYAATSRDSLAEVEYRVALDIDPSSSETLVSMSEFYEKRNRQKEYFETLKLLFASDDFSLDQSVSILNRLIGNKEFYRANYVSITELISEIVLKYPKNQKVVELRAKHLISFGMLDEALEIYKIHAADTPPVFDYFQSIIEIESYKSRPDSVELYVNRALELFPDHIELYITKANTKIYVEEFEVAIESYREALKYSQDNKELSKIWGYIGDVEYQISLVQSKKSKSQAAMKRCYSAYNKALELNPDNIVVLNNYAYFISEDEKGDYHRALSMSSRAIALDESNPTHLDTHAWVLHKLGRSDEAVKYMRTAISLDTSKSPELPLHYGDILAAQGNTFMAEVYWKRAEALGYPAEEIQKRIEGLNEGLNKEQE
ncbi:MAG: tetratricopeptide repeat protein [Rikenellaceae bacterium]